MFHLGLNVKSYIRGGGLDAYLRSRRAPLAVDRAASGPLQCLLRDRVAARARFVTADPTRGLDGGDDGKPVLDKVKNYSCFVSHSTNHPAVTTLNGGEFAFGNTEERLKHRVKGRQSAAWLPLYGCIRP